MSELSEQPSMPYVKCNIGCGERFQSTQARSVIENEEFVGIIRGEESNVNEWPFFIRIHKNGRTNCGGTIIHESIVR